MSAIRNYTVNNPGSTIQERCESITPLFLKSYQPKRVFNIKARKVNQMNAIQNSNSPSSSKVAKTYSIKLVVIFIVVALAIGFIGGMKFSERASRQLLGHDAHMPGNMPMMEGSMPPGMEQQMPPGPANIDIQQAIPRMEELLVKNPNNVELIIHLGNLYYDTHQAEKAVKTYEKALAVDRKNPNVLTDCAVMYRELKETTKAEAMLKEAQKLDPAHFQSKYNLGIIYREDYKQYAKAMDTWKELERMNLTPEQSEQVKKEIEQTRSLMK
jgi:cytochrome c-type biogenesis protein CcmH/NrfG